MKSFISILFILFSIQAGAQKISFTDTSNIWHYNYGDIGGPLSVRGYDFYYADTIITINSLDYMLLQAKKIYGRGGGIGNIFYKILIREDTAAKKIYTRVYDGPESRLYIDSNEQVLFDYTRQKGDTVTQITKNNDTFMHRLAYIDTTVINGTAHKVFHFYRITGQATNYEVIEGIGCVTGVIFPLYPTQFESDFPLYCFTNNGARPAINPKVGFFDNIISCQVSVENLKHPPLNLHLYPQPATSAVNIQLPAIIQSGSLVVYSQLGQVVINSKIVNKESLEINNPGNLHGLYYYRITDNTEDKVYSGKLLFE